MSIYYIFEIIRTKSVLWEYAVSIENLKPLYDYGLGQVGLIDSSLKRAGEGCGVYIHLLEYEV